MTITRSAPGHRLLQTAEKAREPYGKNIYMVTETKPCSRLEGEYIEEITIEKCYWNYTMPGCATVTVSEQLNKNFKGTQKNPDHITEMNRKYLGSQMTVKSRRNTW